MATLTDRITVNPNQCGGRPCIRGMRIRVTDVLDLLSHDLTVNKFYQSIQTLNLRTFAPVCDLPVIGLTILITGNGHSRFEE